MPEEITTVVCQTLDVTLLELDKETFQVEYPEGGQPVRSPLFLNWETAIANFYRRVEELEVSNG